MLRLTLIIVCVQTMIVRAVVLIDSTPKALWNLTDDGFLFNGYDVVSVFPDSAYPAERRARPNKPGEKGGHIPTPIKGDQAISSVY